MNLVNTYVLISFIILLLFYSAKTKYFIHLLIILILSLLNEVIYFLKLETYPFTSTLYIILLFIIWLLILQKTFQIPLALLQTVLAVFVVFSLTNLLFIEKMSFNKYTFVFGSLIYMVMYLIYSFKLLKTENLSLFISNDFLLISAPILFFLGMSFLFGFRSYELTSTIVFGKMTLYKIIVYFVNLVYYTMMNLFILKERKKNYA